MKKSLTRGWLAVQLAALLAGCHAYPVTMTVNGPTQAVTGQSSQIDRFRGAFERAYMTVSHMGVQAGADPQLYAPSIVGSDATNANYEYLTSGVSLVYVNCNDYFAHEGRLQQQANVFKDLNSSFLPIASGAVAIAGSGGTAAGIISLVGAANNGVLNAVYQDFLFDATNIGSVQDMVNSALTADAAKIMANISTPNTTITFDWVTAQIMTHQAICQPEHILMLARDAIATAKPTATNATVPAAAPGVPADAAGGDIPGKPTGAGVNPTPPLTSDVKVQPAAAQADAAAASAVATAAAVKAAVSAQATADAQVTAAAVKWATAATRTVSVVPESPSTDSGRLMRCIFPTATTVSPHGAMLDANGNEVIPGAAAGEIQAWLATQGLGHESVNALVRSSTQAALRTKVLGLFCSGVK